MVYAHRDHFIFIDGYNGPTSAKQQPDVKLNNDDDDDDDFYASVN